MNIDSPIFVPRNNVPIIKAVGAAQPKSSKTTTTYIGKNMLDNNKSIAGYWPFLRHPSSSQFYGDGINSGYLHYYQRQQQVQQQKQQQEQQQQQQYIQHLFQRQKQRTLPNLYNNQWVSKKNIFTQSAINNIGQKQEQQQEQELPLQKKHIPTPTTGTAMTGVTSALCMQTNEERRKKLKMYQQQVFQQQLEQQKQQQLEQMCEGKLQQNRNNIFTKTSMILKRETEGNENVILLKSTSIITTTTTTPTPTMPPMTVQTASELLKPTENFVNNNDANKNELIMNENKNKHVGEDIIMKTLHPQISDTSAMEHQNQTMQFDKEIAVPTKKNDTVQRNSSSRAGHNIRSITTQQNTENSIQSSKADSTDSAISIIPRHQPHQRQQQQQQHNQKQRNKIRSNAKRQDNNNTNMTKTIEKTTNEYSVDEWLDHERNYCYDHGYIPSCAEENLLAARHNPSHRNSTSSDAAASDELQTSSSNEDLSTVYNVISEPKKKTGKPHKNNSQQRQRNPRNQRHQRNNNRNNNQQQLAGIPMDIDEDIKENVRPSMQPIGRKYQQNNQHNNQHHHKHKENYTQKAKDHHQQQQQFQPQQQSQQQVTTNKQINNNNLRMQCTKAAALKAVNKVNKNINENNYNNKIKYNNNIHALTNSPSNSSVCSSLSTVSTRSLTSSKTPSATSASSSTSSSSSSSSSTSSTSTSPTNSANNSPLASPTTIKRKLDKFRKIANAIQPPLRQQIKLNLIEADFVQQLRRYIIDPNLLRVYGYPVESAIHDGSIEIYRYLPGPMGIQSHYLTNKTDIINTADGLHFNHSRNMAGTLSTTLVAEHITNTKAAKTTTIAATAIAKAGINVKYTDNNDNMTDSGQGSGNSSPPSMDSDISEAGEDEPATTTACYTPDGSYQIFSQYEQTLEKQCVRCMSKFHVTEAGEYLSNESCTFHWGKLLPAFTKADGFTTLYTCCNGTSSVKGCTQNSLHVWTGVVVGFNGPYSDFVHTRSRYANDDDVVGFEPKVYALDCEMSFTGLGLEVTKVTLVGFNGEVVYEHFVLPEAEIVDYNTRFSGVTAKDLCKKSNKHLKTLAQVQYDLLLLIDADSILIGHGLDNDLRVLRIVHKTVIDTSIVFPHSSGFPYRRALKNLTKTYLKRDIQSGKMGHSSFEDSRACLELMMWKVRKDMLSMVY